MTPTSDDRREGARAMTDVTRKCVFLSGPVTGLPRDEAKTAFVRARGLCLSLGAGRAYDPVTDVPRGATHEEAMSLCLCELTRRVRGLLRYDLLVSLPGWEASES